ncbi:TolC family protein [Spirosoma rhododendri]|uniref:TolC family protein n=1 Tax=Spirosoma rhododendri TaxID=2728024 RepID=A0A7L5DKU2_9BACT|nr:TolC family protein [Spirosoma rhododendri]QJD77018.1 TolC family protein [Spirosoma rhododendri]
MWLLSLFSRYRPLIVFLSIAALAAGSAEAQRFPTASADRRVTAKPLPLSSDTALLDVSKSLAEQMVPFERIYQLALEHSPAVRFEDAMVDGKVANLQVTKVLILQGVSPFFTYASGNQAYINTGSVTSDFLQLANGRRFGINVQLSMAEVVGRRYRLNQMRSELKAANARRDIIKVELRRDLNRSYQATMTAHRLLGIRIRDAQSAMIAFRIAEVEMQQGKISSVAFASVSNVLAIAQSNVEKERGDFLTYLYDMVALTGVDLMALLANR